MVFKKLVYLDYLLSFISVIGTPFLFSNELSTINVLLILSFCYHFINFIFNNICVYYYFTKNKMTPELKKKFDDNLPVINLIIKQGILVFLHVCILVYQGLKLLKQLNPKLQWIGYLNFTMIMIHFYYIFVLLLLICFMQLKKFTKTSEIPLNVPIQSTVYTPVIPSAPPIEKPVIPSAPPMPEFLESNTIEILNTCRKCQIRQPNILLNCGHTFCAHCLQNQKICFTCEKQITNKKRIEYQ